MLSSHGEGQSLGLDSDFFFFFYLNAYYLCCQWAKLTGKWGIRVAGNSISINTLWFLSFYFALCTMLIVYILYHLIHKIILWGGVISNNRDPGLEKVSNLFKVRSNIHKNQNPLVLLSLHTQSHHIPIAHEGIKILKVPRNIYGKFPTTCQILITMFINYHSELRKHNC